MQNAIIRKNIEDKNFPVVNIKSKTAKALIDSGSSITIVSELFTRTHKLPIKPMGESETLVLISANTGPVNQSINQSIGLFRNGSQVAK